MALVDMYATLQRIARRVWAGPCSILGLVLGGVVLLFGGACRRHSGVLEITLHEKASIKLRHVPFRAITFGHVIIAVSARELPLLRAHEHVHVRQYERWGAAFLIAYAASAIWQRLNGRNAYWDNRFEVEAREEAAVQLPSPVPGEGQGERTTHAATSPSP